VTDVVYSDFAFQTTGREGAVLVMPDGALSEDLRNYKLVEKYIADNAKSWYEYVESDDCGMPTENGDIRVVVGMDKVSSWGMATFENVNVEEPLRFEFKEDGRRVAGSDLQMGQNRCRKGRAARRRDTGPLARTKYVSTPQPVCICSHTKCFRGW
jgi:hypothetical protein